MKKFVVEKEFEHCGLKCEVRFVNGGWRCGYVGVSVDHPLYGVDYGEAELLNCHGGITYASFRDDSDLWWLGFDCAHYLDGNDYETGLKYFPEHEFYYIQMLQIDKQFPTHGEIRTLEYVIENCKLLAEQLVEMMER